MLYMILFPLNSHRAKILKRCMTILSIIIAAISSSNSCYIIGFSEVDTRTLHTRASSGCPAEGITLEEVLSLVKHKLEDASAHA